MFEITSKPRTREEALTHILSEYNAGRLGAMQPNGHACAYESEDGTRHCAIGCLFSPEQLAYIDDNHLYLAGVRRLIAEIGAENIESATGLSVHEAGEIQQMHDHTPSLVGKGEPGTYLHNYLTQELAKLHNVAVAV